MPLGLDMVIGSVKRNVRVVEARPSRRCMCIEDCIRNWAVSTFDHARPRVLQVNRKGGWGIRTCFEISPLHVPPALIPIPTSPFRISNSHGLCPNAAARHRDCPPRQACGRSMTDRSPSWASANGRRGAFRQVTRRRFSLDLYKRLADAPTRQAGAGHRDHAHPGRRRQDHDQHRPDRRR